MNTLKRHLPLILLVLVEIAIGVLLLIDPEAFTVAVVLIFGAIITVIGLVYLFKFISAKRKGEERYSLLVLSILSLAIGIFTIVFSQFVLGFFAFIAVIYAIIMAVSGIFKMIQFFTARQANLPVSFVVLAGAAISVILGIVIIINPFGTTHVLFMFTGIAIICSAVVDMVALIFNFRLERNAIDDGYVEGVVIEE